MNLLKTGFLSLLSSLTTQPSFIIVNRNNQVCQHRIISGTIRLEQMVFQADYIKCT